jgi:hypothetical protein
MNKVLLVITVLCKLNTPGIQMPKEEKIECLDFYADCLVGLNGVYLADKRAECERKYENNKQNRSKND